MKIKTVMNPCAAGKLAALTLLFAAGYCALAHDNAAVKAEDNTAAKPADGENSVASAAKKFLATLDDTQRGKVQFDFGDEAQRKRWSNLPVSAVPRAGLRMGELNDAQREAAKAVVAAALSKQGYEKVMQIVEADEVLSKSSGQGGKGGDGKGGGGGRGDGSGKGDGSGGGKGDGKGGGKGNGGGRGGPGFGRDNYYIAFLGQPSETDPWTIQFGGHHLGLNITLAGKSSTLAPSHTGVQPAIYEVEGKTIRPLGREVDKGFALLESLDEGQRKQAILGFQMRDLVLGPGHDGEKIQPEGIKGSALNDKQREMLADLASEWIGIQNEAVAASKMEDVKKNLAETWFAWSGPIEKEGAAYFRIQGPTVFIEYAPQRLGGDPTKHTHTIYRDPTNEYGRAAGK